MVDYFTNRNSTVFSAFLDIIVAFDRISHHGLFIKLMERKIPLCLLLLRGEERSAARRKIGPRKICDWFTIKEESHKGPGDFAFFVLLNVSAHCLYIVSRLVLVFSTYSYVVGFSFFTVYDC